MLGEGGGGVLLYIMFMGILGQFPVYTVHMYVITHD